MWVFFFPGLFCRLLMHKSSLHYFPTRCVRAPALPLSLVRWDCSTDNGVTSSPRGGAPPSDLWPGKTDELLLPPRFFARSILHVGVRFMNDGDLLKSSIQLPKDTALAPNVPTRNKAITLPNRAMHYGPTPTHKHTHMNTQMKGKACRRWRKVFSVSFEAFQVYLQGFRR